MNLRGRMKIDSAIDNQDRVICSTGPMNQNLVCE